MCVQSWGDDGLERLCDEEEIMGTLDCVVSGARTAGFVAFHCN